ncbi:hypothetical protein D3C80_2211870 [compost metagenome]
MIAGSNSTAPSIGIRIPRRVVGGEFAYQLNLLFTSITNSGYFILIGSVSNSKAFIAVCT